MGRRVFVAHAAFVVAKDHIHDPVQAVFHRPMIADHRSDRVGQQDQRGNVEARLLREPATDLTLALDHDDALQPGPVIAPLQPLYIVDRPIGSRFCCSHDRRYRRVPADRRVLT